MTLSTLPLESRLAAEPAPAPGPQLSAGPLAVGVITDRAELDRIADEWDALLDDSDADGIFLSPDWLLPWQRHFAPGEQLHVLVARERVNRPPRTSAAKAHGKGHLEEGRLLALLPLIEKHEGLPGGGLRTWRLMGAGVVGSDYLGLVARRGQERPAALAFGLWLAQEARRGRLDRLELNDLLEDAPATLALREALAAAFPVPEAELVPGYVCPYVPLAELGPFPGRHLEKNDAELAGQLRRKRRWLERRPGYAFRISTASDVMETWIRLHRWRWTLDGGSGAIDGARSLDFHREAAERLARRGRLRFYLVEADGQPVACIYAFERGGKLYYYQAGYDPSWGRRSVGGILLGLCLEEAAGRGVSELDFLRGSEDYKFRFGSGQRQTVHLRLDLSERARWARRIEQLSANLKGAIKGTLPPGWRGPIVRLWRRLRGQPLSG